MKEKTKRQRFDQEFIGSAVKLVEAGESAAQVAKDLGLPPWRVQGWVRQSKKKANTNNGQEALIMENKRLKRELARAQEETEILKKAATYFAQHQQ